MSSILQVEGGHPLRGEITVRGAKNFVPKAMVASLLADTPSELYNVPLIRDTDVVSDLLSLHGVQIDFDQDRGTLRMDPSTSRSPRALTSIRSRAPRASPILFCGPLLHQLGEAFIPELGGCAIGGRPIDFHLETLRKFGAIIDKQPDGVHIKRPFTGLHGAIIELPFPVGGRHRADPAHRRAQRGHHDLEGRGHRAGDPRPHQRLAEDGRDHLRGHGSHHPYRGRGQADRLPPHGPAGPHRGGFVGSGCPGHPR